MSSKRIRLARLRSSSSQSRSVTPTPDRVSNRPSAARRALMMGIVAGEEPKDPEVEDRLLTPRRPNTQALGVRCTPGGSMKVTEEKVPVQRTPGGSLRRAVDVPFCSDVLERVEAMDVSEEETEELLQTAPWHVQRWVGVQGFGSRVSGCPFLTPVSPTTPTVIDLGSVCVEDNTEQRDTEVYSVGADVTNIPEVDVQPSTSGQQPVTSKQVCRRPLQEGSEFDSDFDDEFDLSPVETTVITGVRKDIPENEELEEPIRDLIGNIERGMDDEADRLLGISANFTWVEGFDSFRGVPELFSGPTPGPVRDYDSAYDAFTDIWDKSIIDRIVLETNRYAKQTIDDLKDKGQLKRTSRLQSWTDTNADEIMVLFGVFMYMAIDPRTSVHEYWKPGVLGMVVFRRLMTYNRYVLLNKFLHFVDNSDQGQNLLQSEGSSSAVLSRKLFKLGPIIEHLGQKFNSLYNLDRHIAIDESLTLFKGRLSWVQTIRTKAARFGIKSYELCESRTGYMARFQIYTGKSDGYASNPDLGVNLGGKSTQVVLQLLAGLERRGHCVTMDNFYNCPSLARYLKSLGFDCLGTLRTGRRNVPNDIAKVPKNVPKGTIIARQCGDVSILTWKDSKLVNIISTYHDDSTFVGSKAGKTLVKPVSVRDYNSTMGGIDLKDQKLSMYLLERKRGLKWYIKMFKRLMNVSVHNALIMYVSSLKRRNKLAVTHREFRYELAQSLIDKHRPCQLDMREPAPELMRLRRDVMHVPKYCSGRGNRKRCVVCYRMKINKMVHLQCIQCDVFLCFEDCWKEWHYSENLKTEVRGRKRKRSE